MSVSRTSHYTPRSSASQGRIVTANSALSAQLRDDSGEKILPASGDTSATNPLALNVVSSSHSFVNDSSHNPNPSALDKVEYVVVSKSRISLNTNTDANDDNSYQNSELNQSAKQEQTTFSTHSNQLQSSTFNDRGRDSIQEHSKGDLSNRYSYYSLKRSGNLSRISTNSNTLINQSHAALNGVGRNVYVVEGNSNINSETSNPDGERLDDDNTESASILRSQYPARQAPSEAYRIAPTQSPSDAQQRERLTNEHSLNAQQHTRLSLYSQHGSVLKEPHSVDIKDQSVPPLDLSRLSGRKSPASNSVSQTPQTVTQTFQDQNLHASDQKSPLVHFTPHDYHRTARTYEVESPYTAKQLPHVKSSENFSGPSDTYRDRGGPLPLNQDTYRGGDNRPSKAGSIHSDLADDLKVPYQFDTQAQEARQSTYHDKPPSPPIPVSPPREKEPATSLRNNSQVYAVANPDIQRAQGIEPQQNNHYTPRQYSQRHSESGVRFDSGSKHRSESRDYNSPVRDRAPTPYNRSPSRSPGEYQRHSPPREDRHRSKPESRNSLPPQHPPLDTKHSHSNSAKTERRQDFGKQLDDAGSVKRVYVESPTFTKEEEEEYRFVSSRIEDNEARDQATFREMDRNKRGYADRDNSKNDYDRNGDREREYYRKQDRYSDKNGDRYEDRNNGRYEDRNRDNMNDYNDDRQKDRYREDDRNGYRDNDRYEDRSKYESYNSQGGYDRLRDERLRYDREPYREEDPDLRQGYRKQNTEIEAQELQREQEYQSELKKRIDKQKIKETDYIPPHERGGFNKENFARDSLDYPDERDRGFARDSLDYNNVHNGHEWGDPPMNPYQDRQDPYFQTDYGQPQYGKEDSKPAFYDPEDAAKMEVVNPTQPKYDYVNLNKHDYGVPPKRSYREIVHKKKEEEEKLEKIFISPKVPPKHGKKKKAQSAQPEHMGYQPPIQDQYPLGFKPSSAEELWAMRSHTLQNQSAGSKKGKGSASKPKKWNSNPNITYKHNYQAPPPLPNQGQTFKPPNMNYPNSPTSQSNQIGQGGYTTPTRHLQPLENKPAPPVSTEYVPTALEPNSPFRRHMELKPITQEIVTDDGQRISVDINLRLVSPPPGQGNSPQPGQHQQQQLALVPVQETQGNPDANQSRPIGVPYTLQDQYGYDNGYQAYQELRRQQLRESLLTSSREKKSVTFGEVQDGYQGNSPLALEGRYNDIEDQIAHEQMALAEQTGNTGYAKRYAPGSVSYREEEASESDAGYSALYHKNRSKDPNEKPWYKIYDIHDYKKMQREVRVARGTLGPDLDTEPFREKCEKRHKQFEYARMVMEKNKMELSNKKPPQFPRHASKEGEENVKRKAALDYAKTVPKPTVKPRPNQYNSYEVAAQLGAPGLSPKGRNSPASSKSPPPKTLDVIDIHSLEQRHLQERKTADKIRRNMEGVMTQKAH